MRSAKKMYETWRPKIKDNLHWLFDEASKEVENPPFFDIFFTKNKDFIGRTQAEEEIREQIREPLWSFPSLLFL